MPRSRRYQYRDRAPVDREAPTLYVLVARGEVSLNDRDLITRILGRFGLESSFVTEASYKAEQERVHVVVRPEKGSAQYRFTNITNPEQFIVREHFEDFRDNIRPDLGTKGRKVAIGKVFNKLVDGCGGSRRLMTGWENGQKVYREPEPLPGIVIAKRDDIGLPPYQNTITDTYSKTKDLVGYAIQSGSLLAYAETILPESKQSLVNELILIMSRQLKYQFGSE